MNELEALCEAQGYDVKKENNKYTNSFIKQLHKFIIWEKTLEIINGEILAIAHLRKRAEDVLFLTHYLRFLGPLALSIQLG